MSPRRKKLLLWVSAILAVPVIFVVILALEQTGARFISRKREEALRDRCKVLLSNLEDYMKVYQRDHSRFPPTGRKGLLLSTGPIEDPWGQEFVFVNYEYPHSGRGMFGRGSRCGGWIDLYSIGPNGIDEQGDGDDVRVGD
ncbi:MAG TPA: hypothetical protein VJU16_01070 [Planctomycetota bacterium]|nr:hypothetical protein [Planctomycetota bacterium]